MTDTELDQLERRVARLEARLAVLGMAYATMGELVRNEAPDPPPLALYDQALEEGEPRA